MKFATKLIPGGGGASAVHLCHTHYIHIICMSVPNFMTLCLMVRQLLCLKHNVLGCRNPEKKRSNQTNSVKTNKASWHWPE